MHCHVWLWCGAAARYSVMCLAWTLEHAPESASMPRSRGYDNTRRLETERKLHQPSVQQGLARDSGRKTHWREKSHSSVWGHVGRASVTTRKAKSSQSAGECWLASARCRVGGCIVASIAGLRDKRHFLRRVVPDHGMEAQGQQNSAAGGH